MAYDPNLYNPFGRQNTFQMQQSPAIPVNGIVYVNDIDVAKGYQMPPNSVSPPLMLKSDNVFIVKETDGSGGATLTAYRFEETPLSSLEKPGEEYVTKADLEAFADQLMEAINGKHAVKPNDQNAE